MSKPMRSSGTGPIDLNINEMFLRLHERLGDGLHERLWQYLWGDVTIQTRVKMRVSGIE